MGLVHCDHCRELLGAVANILVGGERFKEFDEKEMSSTLLMLLSLHGPSSDERGEPGLQGQATQLGNHE